MARGTEPRVTTPRTVSKIPPQVESKSTRRGFNDILTAMMTITVRITRERRKRERRKRERRKRERRKRERRKRESGTILR